jgi:zinc transporter ZupT
MTPFVLLIGLGTHSIFEGLAVGISGDTSEVLIFALAIVLHKGAAGMSLGISMAQTFPG